MRGPPAGDHLDPPPTGLTVRLASSSRTTTVAAAVVPTAFLIYRVYVTCMTAGCWWVASPLEPCPNLPGHMHGHAIPFYPPGGRSGGSPRSSDGGYLGCYQDNPQRTMTDWGSGGAHATVEKCRDMALKAGYAIFSVQFAYQCFGSNDFPAATRLGLSTACYMGCAGADYQECGGPYTNSLYIAAVGEARLRDDSCWARQAYPVLWREPAKRLAYKPQAAH